MQVLLGNHQCRHSGVASPNIWGGKNFGGSKIFDFTRITLFCLEKRLSKHKMTTFSKNLGRRHLGPLYPPGYGYVQTPINFSHFVYRFVVKNRGDNFERF